MAYVHQKASVAEEDHRMLTQMLDLSVQLVDFKGVHTKLRTSIL